MLTVVLSVVHATHSSAERISYVLVINIYVISFVYYFTYKWPKKERVGLKIEKY